MDEKTEVTRLNKFIAQCGIATRREAVEVIKKGFIKVNEVVQKDPFYEVKTDDQITYKDKAVSQKKNYVYFLINKPKNSDTNTIEGSETRPIGEYLIDIPQKDLKPFIPMGAMELGVLVLTNDVELLTKIEKNSYKTKAIYHITLDKSIDTKQLARLSKGIPAKYGKVLLDSVRLLTSDAAENEDANEAESVITHNELMISYHSLDTTALRKYLTSMGLEIIKSDRLSMGNLTKKDLKRGWFRPLTEKEVIFLKYFQ